MDALLAQYGSDVGFMGLAMLLVVSLLRGWLVVGSTVRFLAEALATERARADRAEERNIRLMTLVEAGLAAGVVDSKQEAL